MEAVRGWVWIFSGIAHFTFKHEQLKKKKMDAVEKKINNLVKDTAFH